MKNKDIPTKINVEDEIWSLLYLDRQTGDTYEPSIENAENKWLVPIYARYS